MFRFSKRSYASLSGVRPELIAVASRVLLYSPIDFVVTEGLRTLDRQRELVRIGASQTMNSRHLTGHAIDVAAWHNGGIRWDWPLYEKIALAFKQASEELSVNITWGGDWVSLRDGPHFELNRRDYPA
jgi:peptidoglycan L-alanyl-D-glutamate endopeptidase CwlK